MDIGDAAFTIPFHCHSSVCSTPISYDYFKGYATLHLFQQSTGRDNDNPPSCVVGFSQTRPAGTGQFHFTEIDEELGMDDPLRQFHLAQLYGILLLCRNSKQRDSVRLHRPLSRLSVSQIQ